jgi:hypothetical protein
VGLVRVLGVVSIVVAVVAAVVADVVAVVVVSIALPIIAVRGADTVVLGTTSRAAAAIDVLWWVAAVLKIGRLAVIDAF